MCLPNVSPSGRNVSKAYDGRPPARSGIIAASSARQKQSTTPIAVRIAKSRNRGAAERDEREADEADDQDRPRQADHERSPPVGLAGERAFLVRCRGHSRSPALGGNADGPRVSHVPICTSSRRYARRREPHTRRQAMTHDEVRKRAKDEGIEFFLAQFVEMHGKPNAKLMPVEAIDDLLEEGAGFAGFAAGPIGPDAGLAGHAGRARHLVVHARPVAARARALRLRRDGRGRALAVLPAHDPAQRRRARRRPRVQPQDGPRGRVLPRAQGRGRAGSSSTTRSTRATSPATTPRRCTATTSS